MVVGRTEGEDATRAFAQVHALTFWPSYAPFATNFKLRESREIRGESASRSDQW